MSIRNELLEQILAAIQGGGGGYADGYLTARSDITQAMPTSADGAVVNFEVVSGSNKANVVGGVITTASNGLWAASASLNLNVGIGFADTVESWVEYFDGADWQFFPNSGKVINFSTFSESTIAYLGVVDSTVGDAFRIKVRATGGNPTLEAESLDNGILVPSASLALIQVSEA